MSDNGILGVTRRSDELEKVLLAVISELAGSRVCYSNPVIL